MELNNIDISKLPADVRRKFKQLQVMHAEKKIQNKAKDDFLSFVKCMWPDFIEGSHHRHIADKFNKLATGEITRLIVNMPPRACLLYTSPSPRDGLLSRMPSSA